VVPREDLRDTTWPKEIKKHVSPPYQNNFTGVCWKSLSKTDLSGYDMLILDEGHHLTELSFPNIEGFAGAILALSATPPNEYREESKFDMMRSIAPLVYQYGLEKGIEEEINAPYMFHIIHISPDITNANIPAGSKAKPFKQTEFAALQYLDKAIQRAAITGDLNNWRGQGLIRKRMQLIYNSKTKQQAARQILLKTWDKDKRFLVFGGSIEQISTLLPKHSYHSKNKGKKDNNLLKDFQEKRINLLGTVGMTDEGQNIDDLDIGIVIQADSNERRMIQRLGRMVRVRENYTAHVYGLCLRGTQDEKWFQSCTSSLPSYRTRHFIYDSLNDFKNTTEWIIQPTISET
jgi:superfamily II DNA or RNA helicase